MTPEDPRHGEYRGALAHWRSGETACAACAAAARRMRKGSILDQLAGNPRTVRLGEDAHAIVMNTPRNLLIATTGFGNTQMRRLTTGGADMIVLRRTRERLLAARPAPWTPIGIQRRLQALSVLGWSMMAVSEECGVFHDSLKKLRRRQEVKHVRRGIGDSIAAAFDALAMTPPPRGQSATETRAKASGRGWLPPLAWDNIDDPDENPCAKPTSRPKTDVDHAVILRVMAGDKLPMTTAERRAVVARARGLGWSEETIHARTGIAKATDKTRFGDHFPDCGCMPGTAENGWIEKQAAGCAAEQVGRAA